MRWFGADWGAPICEMVDQAPVPVGQPCLSCKVAIGPFDRGFLVPHFGDERSGEMPWHHACLMSNVLGPDWEAIVKEVDPR